MTAPALWTAGAVVLAFLLAAIVVRLARGVVHRTLGASDRPGADDGDACAHAPGP